MMSRRPTRRATTAGRSKAADSVPSRVELETAQIQLESRYARLSAATSNAQTREREQLRRALHVLAAILADAWQDIAASPAAALAELNSLRATA